MAAAIVIPYTTPLTVSLSNMASSKSPAFGHPDGNGQGESVFVSLPNLARLLARGREPAFQGWSALAKTVPSCGHADGARLERSDSRIPNWFAPDHT